MRNLLVRYFFILFVSLLAVCILIPRDFSYSTLLFGKEIQLKYQLPNWLPSWELKQGLDIKGGIQVVLSADLSAIAEADHQTAIESAREIILRRVDLFGLSEPVVQSVKVGEAYRINVALAGVTDQEQALQLVGTTAQLTFKLQNKNLLDQTSTPSAFAVLNSFEEIGLGGQHLRRAIVQFEPTTNEPVISLEFDETGRDILATITRDHQGETLGIFLDDTPVALPTIQSMISNGQAQLSGGFELEEAKQLAIQLNAGALPVPITILEQRAIGASLGQTSVAASMRAGLIGLSCVIFFMIVIYGWKGVISGWALVLYGAITLAVYKVLGVTLTLPGIAGLLLTIGMAVDANILIFERMKEELRLGKTFQSALELGFGRAWDSIKDANIATIATALVLINPLDFSFLNTSGLVRGFGITLLIGVTISLFTGVFVTRTFMRLFLKEPKQ